MTRPGPFPRALLTLAALAVLLRIAFFLNHAASLPFLGHPMLDAALYDAWARALAEGRSFADGPFYQSPGYPYALSFLYRILGPAPAAGIAVNAVLGSATVVLTALLGRRLFGPREGIVAGLLLLGTGTLYFYEATLLITTSAVFLGVLALVLLLRAEEPGRSARSTALRFGLAGLAAGVLSVTRANLILLPALMGLFLLVRALRTRTAFPAFAAYALAAGIAILPSFLHNLSRGATAPVAVQGGYNFYAGNHRGATGVYENIPGVSGGIETQEAEIDSLVRAATGRALPPDEESRYWLSRGLAEIRDDPARWLALLGRKAWLLVNRQEETVNSSLSLETSRVAVLRLLAVPFNLVAGLGLVGLALALARPGSDRRPLLGPVALLAAVLATSLLFFVMSRIRLPALPVLAVFAGHALARAWDAWRAGRRAPVAIGALGLAAFVVLSWRSPLGEARNAQWEARLFTEAARSMERADPEAAAKAYREALAVDPTAIDPVMALGNQAMKAGDLPGAVAAFEQAARIEPGNPTVRSNLGILYYASGRLEESAASMNAAIGIDPSLAAPYLYRGMVRYRLGDPTEAMADLEAAIERDPTLSTAYQALVRVLLDRGEVEEARRWAETAGERGVALPAEVVRELADGDE